MKTIFLSLILLAACSAGLRAAGNQPAAPAKNEAPTPAALLAAQVKQIAATPDMSDKSKAKLISRAVGLAITKALAGVDDPEEALRLAAELAGAATKAAPRFADAITRAVMTNPVVAGVDGALAKVEAAVHAAVQAANFASKPVSDRGNSHSDFGGSNGDVVVSPSF